MKTLYLMRHAKSSWDSPGLNDSERPLNGRGKKNAVFMGNLLRKMNEIPDLIISSPAKRAYSTSKRVAGEIDYPVKKISKEEKLYMADTNEFLSVIRDIENDINKVMLISHNSGITRFANFISQENIVNIPTAGIVRVDFKMDSWKEITETKGKMIFFEYPKKYKENVGL